MTAKRMLIMVLVLSVTAALLAGCGKKRTETMPPGATKVEVVEEPVDWGEQQPAQQQGPTEEELLAQRKAKAVQDLTEIIFFAFDSNELSSESREILQAKADVLKQFRDLTMVIEGYCDERGTVEYNLALGERRARAAYDYLVILGVSPDRLSIVSFGEENPLDPGSNEQAWAKNRRDQFRVFQ
jgi:peptidoglycan-associated lipoprotein